LEKIKLKTTQPVTILRNKTKQMKRTANGEFKTETAKISTNTTGNNADADADANKKIKPTLPVTNIQNSLQR
jgi:hypothetical protein